MMFANTMLANTIWTLRAAFKKSKAPIWRALEKQLRGPRANRSEVNVGTLGEISKAGEVLVIPGKVLGTGNIGHKVTICAYSVSEGAAKKIISAGGRVIGFEELAKKHPDGKGVRIIG